MLQKNLSTLVKRTLLECPPFLCTEDPEKSWTSLSTPLYQFFLRCPPIPRGYQALQQLHPSALLLMMSCPLIFITSSFMELYLMMYDRRSRFVFFRSFNHPCHPVIPSSPFLL